MNRLAAQFPLPEEKTILLDLDGTVIDDTYETTDDRLYGVINDIQKSGWQVGINSDTPLEVIRKWSKELGLKGPNIAEGGAVVEAKDEIIYSQEQGKLFMTLQNSVKNRLNDVGDIVWDGDPVAFLRNGSQIGQFGDTIFLMNNLRLCSLGVFVRQVAEDGTLLANNSLTDLMAEEVRPFYRDAHSLVEDVNYDHGLIIVSHESADKRAGVMRLQEASVLGKIAMIGNSTADHLGSDVAIHYAVGNADNKFKELADYVASGSLSSGVVEILSKLLSESKS